VRYAYGLQVFHSFGYLQGITVQLLRIQDQLGRMHRLKPVVRLEDRTVEGVRVHRRPGRLRDHVAPHREQLGPRQRLVRHGRRHVRDVLDRAARFAVQQSVLG
jgi:hypothetical protein